MPVTGMPSASAARTAAAATSGCSWSVTSSIVPPVCRFAVRRTRIRSPVGRDVVHRVAGLGDHLGGGRVERDARLAAGRPLAPAAGRPDQLGDRVPAVPDHLGGTADGGGDHLRGR